jgi:predicted anti-sigma-YlaC factor YlaD
MNCTTVKSWLFRKLDGELSDSESIELDAHLANCISCSREYRLLALPNRIAQINPPPEPSPFFYQKLKARIDGEIKHNAIWQALWGLARPMVSTLAGITLALLSVFAYFQMHGREVDLYKTYDRAFIFEDQSNQMLVADQGDITYERVLNTIAEQESNYHRNQNLK